MVSGAMEMEIDLLIEASDWDETGLAALAEAALPMALAEVGLVPSGYAISILAGDDARIAALNAEFRGKPTPTNVLSWPSEERGAPEPGARPDLPEAMAPDGPPVELGDIALAYGVCAREAAQMSKPMADHVTHLLVHGLLHCLGYDHETDADAALMEGLETAILARLGLPDPY